MGGWAVGASGLLTLRHAFPSARTGPNFPGLLLPPGFSGFLLPLVPSKGVARQGGGKGIRPNTARGRRTPSQG